MSKIPVYGKERNENWVCCWLKLVKSEEQGKKGDGSLNVEVGRRDMNMDILICDDVIVWWIYDRWIKDSNNK